MTINADQRSIDEIGGRLQESQQVEVKNWMGGLSTAEAKARLAKEIIALANFGGGYIYIGFDDSDGNAEIAPQQNEREAFTQDAIASIVDRYVTPSIQIHHAVYRRKYVHPVLLVSGDQRTPVWAKSGAPNNNTNILQSSVLYTRRPGGNSEPLRSQDDWERLLDRFVRAREEHLIESIRNVLDPQRIVKDDSDSLDEWFEESMNRWESYKSRLSADSELRFDSGFWISSFSIDGVSDISVNDIGEFIRSYPEGIFSTSYHGSRYRPHGQSVEIWYEEGSAHLAGYFLRIDTQGRGFTIQDYFEDDAQYCSNRSPRPKRPCFDLGVHPFRIAELLKFIEKFAEHFGVPEGGKFKIDLRYYKMEGRKLDCHDRIQEYYRGNENSGPDTLDASLTANVSDIRANKGELIKLLLDQIYMQFNFAECSAAAIRSALHHWS